MRHARPLLAALLAIVACSLPAHADAKLPLTRLVLFSSGVGYFERAGQVQGDDSLQLSFKTEQINDLLKSLVLQDFDGGRIGPVVYAPQDPVAHQLKSFSVDLSQQQPLSAMLTALRGARVEIVADEVLQGQVIGVETQQKTGDKAPVLFQVINLLTDKGIVQVPIWHVKTIKLLDAKLSDDLQQALGVLAASHDSGKRPLTVSFLGNGARRVRVGYLLETPVWKTSYRLVSDAKGLLLQGWAVVENTTDDDWQGVNLALVSGRPISFIQDLYTPLYVQRPEVAPSVIGSPPPQTYGANLQDEERQLATGDRGPAGPAGPAGPEGAVAARKASPRARAGRAIQLPEGIPADAVAGYMPQNALINLRAQEGQAMAQGEKVGELFQYAIDQPVSIGRQKSAMIPILNKDIEGTKVSVYNQRVNAKFPLNGIKLKNTSGLHLQGGPITVFDGGAYAGDALITDIAPGDERLLTYAVDLSVEVDPKQTKSNQELTSLKAVHGVLIVTRKLSSEMTFTVKNVAAEARTVLIEHPIRQNWTLIAPAKADEKTRDVYRFKVVVAPKSTVAFKVAEEMPESESISLSADNLDQIGVYLRAPKISIAMRDALQKAFQMRAALADTVRQRTENEARLQEINTEQDRIRKNMAQLDRQDALYKQYVQKLTAQEAEFEKLQGEITILKTREKQQRDELAKYIDSLDVG